MSNFAQIKLQLKALKLSGMLQTVEHRLMEAEANSLAFSEALSMLLTDESDARKTRRLDRLIKRAHLEANKTLESFDFSANASVNASRIRELAHLSLHRERRKPLPARPHGNREDPSGQGNRPCRLPAGSHGRLLHLSRLLQRHCPGRPLAVA